MINEQHVNFFKFDGIAGGIITDGAPVEYLHDVFGLIKLVLQLREIKVRLACPAEKTKMC